MVLRELVTVLGFEVKDAPLKQMESNMEHIKETMHRILEVYVGEKIIHGLIDGIREFGETSREIMDASLLGLDTTQYQVLQQSAMMFGVQRQRFNMGLALMQRQAYEAMRGNKDAAETFARLQMSITNSNGHLKNAQQLIYGVADGLKAIQDTTERNAITEKLFGMRDIEFENLLLKGSKGLQQLAKDAASLGYIMDEKAVKAGKEFQENMVQLQLAGMGLKNMLMAQLVPQINEAAKALMNWLRDPEHKKEVIKKIKDVASALVDVFRKMFSIVMILINAFYYFSKSIGGAGNAVVVLISLFGSMIAMDMALKIGKIGIGFWKIGKFIWACVPAITAFASVIGSMMAYCLPLFVLLLAIFDIIGAIQGKKSVTGTIIHSVKTIFASNPVGGNSHLTEYAQGRLATLAGESDGHGQTFMVNQKNEITVHGAHSPHETATAIANHVGAHTSAIIKNAHRIAAPRQAY